MDETKGQAANHLALCVFRALPERVIGDCFERFTPENQNVAGQLLCPISGTTNYGVVSPLSGLNQSAPNRQVYSFVFDIYRRGIRWERPLICVKMQAVAWTILFSMSLTGDLA